MSPIEGRIIDPDRASQYLKTYFQNEKISTFWGSPEDFMRKLAQKCAQKGIINLPN